MSDDFKRSENCEGCTRRELLRSAGIYIAGVSIFGLSACASAPTLRGHRRDNEIAVSRAAVEAATGPLTIVADGLANPVILIAGGESFVALSARCTHQGCSVRVNSGALRCPCHGSTFALDGKVLSGPARRSLRQLPLRWTTNELRIEIGE